MDGEPGAPPPLAAGAARGARWTCLCVDCPGGRGVWAVCEEGLPLYSSFQRPGNRGLLTLRVNLKPEMPPVLGVGGSLLLGAGERWRQEAEALERFGVLWQRCDVRHT